MFLGATSLLFGGTTAFAFEGSAEFGDVPLGQTNVLTVQIIASSTSEITLTELSLEKGDSSEFSIKTILPEGGIHVLPNEPARIEVAYTPTALGTASDTLLIITNNPWIRGFVSLTGTGVEAVEPRAPRRLKGMLHFFDDAVDNGRLEGKGRGKSAKRRLHALRNMIRSTEKLHKSKNKRMACRRWQAISRKIESHVQGDAAGELSAMVNERIRALGCK
jgi:hypothetical protein